MKQLVLCLIDWVDQLHASGRGPAALRALASETLKRVESPDSEQRQFDAIDLAQAAEPGKEWDYDQAKQWLANAKLSQFVDARLEDMSGFFRDRGHLDILIPQKSETAGRHRAQWFLKVQPLPIDPQESDLLTPVPAVSAEKAAAPDSRLDDMVYEYTGPGELRLSPVGWLLLGRQGSAPTRSARGLVWVGIVLVIALIFLAILFAIWAMGHLQRPVMTADLASLVMLVATGLIVWKFWAQPLTWLLDDRITLAPELLTAFSEEPCQLELPKDIKVRHIRLVRYSGVCPVCAGQIGLRYGDGAEARRLFGACSEAPQDHVFSFDRVTRKGRRVRAFG